MGRPVTPSTSAIAWLTELCPVFSQLFLKAPGKEKLLVSGGSLLAAIERLLNLVLDCLKLSEALRQDSRDGVADGFLVGLLHEVHVVLQLPRDHARQVEDPVGRDLHLTLSERSRSVNGCRRSCSKTSGGIAATSAPMRAESRTWTGLRSSATRIWV